MYRPDWFPTDCNVLDIVLELHSSVVGSLEISKEQQKFDYKCLLYVVDNWRKEANDFDGYVLNLINTAITEYENS